MSRAHVAARAASQARIHVEPVAPWICGAMRAIFVASSPMRSRSVMVLLTAMIRRRSVAAGWRLAMIWLQALVDRHFAAVDCVLVGDTWSSASRCRRR